MVRRHTSKTLLTIFREEYLIFVNVIGPLYESWHWDFNKKMWLAVCLIPEWKLYVPTCCTWMKNLSFSHLEGIYRNDFQLSFHPNWAVFKRDTLLAVWNWYTSTCPSPHQSTQRGFNEHHISKVLSIWHLNEDIGWYICDSHCDILNYKSHKNDFSLKFGTFWTISGNYYWNNKMLHPKEYRIWDCIFCDFLINKRSKEWLLFGASWTIYYRKILE